MKTAYIHMTETYTSIQKCVLDELQNITEKWYKHQLDMATEHNDDSIICCMPIHTNRKMKINKTKIIIIKNRRKMVHVHQHNNTIPEKLLSESYPTIKDMEINSMWHTRIKIRLMVITDLQHMKKVMEKFTNYISDTINIYTV